MIKRNYFTTFSACILCLDRSILQKFYFSNKFKGVAAEDTFLQMRFMDKEYKVLHSNKIKVYHDADLTCKGLLKKIIYQCKGTHRLIANSSKYGIKKMPYSTFYLDFPLLIFLSFYIGILLTIITGFSWYYVSVLLGASILDFHKLYRVIFTRSYGIKRKIEAFIYVILNEGIKIFDWPISLIRERYSLKDLIFAVKTFVYWEFKKFVVRI